MLLLDDNLFNSINDIGLLSSNLLVIAVGVADFSLRLFGVAPIHPAPTQGLDSSERDRFYLSRHR